MLLVNAADTMMIGGKDALQLYSGGKGADHVGCSNSAPSPARSVVMDYNPTQGEKISGTCKHLS
jgi:hypothetical protein